MKKKAKDLASSAWTEVEVDILKKHRASLTIQQLQDKLKEKGFVRSRKAIERKCAGLGLFFAPKQEDPAKEKLADAYEENWKLILQLKEKYRDGNVTTRRRGIITPGKKLIKRLVMGDFHIPFEREDLIKEVVEEHADATELVLTGDILDLHAISTWPKERSVALRHEYMMAIEYMKYFTKKFDRVYMIRGNHEYRLNRYFHSNVSPSISFLVNKEILDHVARGYVYDKCGNVESVVPYKGKVIYNSGQEAWFLKLGKTMFVHPQSFSRVNGKTSVLTWEYFMDREDIDSVVVAHTHQQARIIKRGRLCIEHGCLCAPLDYEKQGKLTYEPQCLGYAVIYQDEEGNTDFNKSGVRFLGIQYPDNSINSQLIIEPQGESYE